MARSWQKSKHVTSQAWGVIKDNKYMLGFPAVSAVLAVLVFLIVGGIGLAALGVNNVADQAANDDFSTTSLIVGAVFLFIASYLATLITQIFMGGLVKCADEELQGRDSSFGAGLSAADHATQHSTNTPRGTITSEFVPRSDPTTWVRPDAPGTGGCRSPCRGSGT